MFETRREALAWAAGFFDGEGCFYAFKSQPRKDGTRRMIFRAALCQKDKSLLIKFHEVVGGLGILSNKVNPNDVWRWSTTRIGEAEALFHLLEEWLSERRIERAKELIYEEANQEPLRRTGGSPRKGVRVGDV